MSVQENLTLALLPRLARAGILDEEEQRKVVTAFIEQLRIKCSSLGQPIRELSGGNQQKGSPRALALHESEVPHLG